MYDAWFKLWRDTYVPLILHQPKRFDTDKDLLPGDLVYFNKTEGKLGKKSWSSTVTPQSKDYP